MQTSGTAGLADPDPVSRMYLALNELGFIDSDQCASAIGKKFIFTFRIKAHQKPVIIFGMITGLAVQDAKTFQVFVSVPMIGQDKLWYLVCDHQRLKWEILLDFAEVIHPRPCFFDGEIVHVK